MRIAVLGTGYVGGALGRRWAEAGHEVIFGSREPGGTKAAQLLEQCSPSVHLGTWEEAAEAAEVIVLAVPWSSVPAILDRIRDALDGKILIDCINPLNASFTGLDLGFSTSAAEEIARQAPHAKVVKAFNTVSASSMEDPRYGDQQAAMFYCGNDEEAIRVVHRLAEELGFDPILAGPLQNARYLEPLAMLYIYLAMNGWGSNCAFQMLQREKNS